MQEQKSLNALVDAALSVERLRVGSRLRQVHLAKKGRSDPETDGLLVELEDLEKYIDGRVAEIIVDHPAYHWFSLVRGIGRENIAKVIGLVDISKAPTISSLWMFAGVAPEAGRAMKRVKGQKLRYNSQLRSMCWRLGSSLKRATGKYYDYYIKEKEKYARRFEGEGKKILPTPQGRWVCLNCGQFWTKKVDIEECCQDQNIGKKSKEEPEGVIWKGHLDMMAMRKMIKLFLAHLWLIWREAEGLPTSKPYAAEKLGHQHVITPWEMTDKEEEAEV